VSLLGTQQRSRRGRGIERRNDEAPLILRGQSDDAGLLNGAARGFLRGGGDKIADASGQVRSPHRHRSNMSPQHWRIILLVF